MARYLLDTDALVDWINSYLPTEALISGLLREANDLCTCSVVVAEVYSGLVPGRDQRARDLLASCEYLDCSPEAAQQAGEWRRDFSVPGRPMLGIADMLIAAIAKTHDATLVTGNVRDFPMKDVRLQPLPRPNRRA